jgi:hypothetical protein
MPACPVGPRENTGTGPADRTGMVIFFTCLDLEQKSSFIDGHYLKFILCILMWTDFLHKHYADRIFKIKSSLKYI